LTSKSAAPASADWRYDADEDAFYIEAGGDVKVTNVTRSARIIVEAGSSTITLENVFMDLTEVSDAWDGVNGEYENGMNAIAGPIALRGGANLQINLSGNNTITAGYCASGIYVPSNANLTVTSAAGDGKESGVLTVRGGWLFSGIGGGYYGSFGTITISGGTIYTTGGYGGAGPGACYMGSGGNITILGVVRALGGDWVAGIGGGEARFEQTSGDIYIRGGEVYATSGGGYDGAGRTISITGGTGTATASRTENWAAGCSVGHGAQGSNTGTFTDKAGNNDWPAPTNLGDPENRYEW